MLSGFKDVKLRTRYCLTKARTLRTLASIVEPISSQKYSLICDTHSWLRSPAIGALTRLCHIYNASKGVSATVTPTFSGWISYSTTVYCSCTVRLTGLPT